MKYCINCGEPNSDENKVCANCQKPFPHIENLSAQNNNAFRQTQPVTAFNQVQSVPLYYVQQSAAPTAQKRNKMSIIGLISGILFLIRPVLYYGPFQMLPPIFVSLIFNIAEGLFVIAYFRQKAQEK